MIFVINILICVGYCTYTMWSVGKVFYSASKADDQCVELHVEPFKSREERSGLLVDVNGKAAEGFDSASAASTGFHTFGILVRKRKAQRSMADGELRFSPMDCSSIPVGIFGMEEEFRAKIWSYQGWGKVGLSYLLLC